MAKRNFKSLKGIKGFTQGKPDDVVVCSINVGEFLTNLKPEQADKIMYNYELAKSNMKIVKVEGIELPESVLEGFTEQINLIPIPELMKAADVVTSLYPDHFGTKQLFDEITKESPDKQKVVTIARFLVMLYNIRQTPEYKFKNKTK